MAYFLHRKYLYAHFPPKNNCNYRVILWRKCLKTKDQKFNTELLHKA